MAINFISARSNPREEEICPMGPTQMFNTVEGMIKEVFPQLLNKEDYKVGQAKNCTHEIRLKPGTTPIKHRVRRVPVHLRDELKACIDSMLERGIIRPSKSEWAAPLVLVRKKDGTLRVCVDYRDLNNATVKDAYPMPNIDDIIYRLYSLEIASTFDLVEGYNQVEMREEHKSICAFATDWGLFEPNVMTFGLTNAPATFQRMMNEVLGEEIDKCCLYLVDELVFSKSREAHFRDVYVVCFRLAAAGLRLKWEKCKIEQEEVEYLGHVITRGQIKPSPTKVQKILQFQLPASVKQLRGFLGLTGYFRKFIRNYSAIASPLYEATSVKDKDGKPIAVGKRRSEKVRLELSEKATLAFEKLKNCLTTTTSENPDVGILLMPNFDKPFVLYTDACDEGLGAVLCQEDEATKCRPIAFYSRKLKASERKYAIGEKELMAIVFAMEHYKVYLYGKEFVVRTDHRPLQWLKDLKNPSTRLARWLIIVRQFSFKIEFISGIQNAAADALFRFFIHGSEEVEDEVESQV